MSEQWKIIYNEYDPKAERLREALCALGNGYIVTRAAAEESNSGTYHYPGTYLAGGYNRVETEVAGKIIENEDLVNWPNWLVLKFKHFDSEEWIKPETLKILAYKQELDLKEGILKRIVQFEDNEQRRTT